MSNIINVVVKDAKTPEEDIIVPDTGWYTSGTEKQDTGNSFVAPFIGIGVISFVVLLLLILAKRKLKTSLKYFGILSILAILGIGASIYGIIANNNVSASDDLISITSSDTTITVIRGAEGETTYGVATATIKLNETTPLGYTIFAYTPDGNVLTADIGDGEINPVTTNNSALTNNTWGIALTDQAEIKAEDTVWNKLEDESSPLLVASFDESTTAGTTVTLRYGVLVDNTLPVGVYSANIEYKAYQRAYNITFNPGEGEITTPTKPVIIGEPIGELPTPTRTNYNFLGWYTEETGGTKIDENTVPDQNSTYFAHWERITYSITFNPGEGTIISGDATKTVQAGEPLGTLPEAARDNYTFTGWYTQETGGERVTTATVPTAGTSYYAHWSRDTYTITFNAGEGTIDQQDAERSINAGDAIGTLPNATRTNYTLDGWYTAETGGTKITAETTPTGTTTYYAHWNRNEYTITYNLMGGNIAGDTTNPTATVQAGDSLGTLPQEPSKTNHTFAGWWTEETGGTQVTTETRPDGTTTYFAHWDRIEYTITFDLNGGNISGDTTNPTATVQAGDSLGTLPQEPSMANHTFAGWWTEKTGGTQVTTATTPAGTTTYFAHWTVASVTVTFDTDGGSTVPVQTLTPGEKATRPATNPTKSGYNFVDWYTNDSYNTLFDFDTPINTNTTVYARFVEDRYIAEMNGDVYETIQSAVDIAPSSQTTIRLLADTSEKVTIGSGQDIILNLNSETLLYPGSGENVIINKGTLTLENGTVSSTGGKGMINNNAGATLTTRNVNLAVTTTTPKQVIYNNGGTAYILEGTNIETQSSSAGAVDNHGGTMVIENARIVATGSRQGVYNDNNASLEIRGENTYISAKPDVGSTNRAAVQSVNGSLVITGGTIVSKDYAVTVQDGSFRLGTQDDAYNDENPEIRGGVYGIQSSVNYAIYDGIVEGKTAAVNDETKITGKETNYGKVNDTKDIDGTTYQTIYYETETEYTITFNLNGGNINGSTTNPTVTVQIGDTLGPLPTEPTRTNYTFDGWYTELNGGTKITANTRPTESRSYYAHWNRIEYTITYNLNGGNISGSTTSPTATVYAGDTLGSLPTEPTRTNYTFDGWFTAETGGDEVTTGTIPTGTTTYFAHWTLVAVTFDDAYAAAGKTRDVTSGKYTLQDMDNTICNAVSKSSESDYSDTQETQLVDLRDGKIYWVAKLLDGKCWMTQNLDYDLDSNTALVHASSDIGWGSDTSTMSWTPERSTIPTSSISSTGSISGWTKDYNNPYSIDTGDWYWIGNWKNNGTDTWYSSTTNNYLNTYGSGAGDKFSTSEYAGNGKHGHVGNYYNWTATIASNDSTNYNASTVTDITTNPQNSICPAGWRLPTISNEGDVEGSTSEFRRLVGLYGNTTGNDRVLTASPLWFVRSGNVTGSSLNNSGYGGLYWSNTVYNSNYSYYMYFFSDGVISAYYSGYRDLGWSVRCVARDMSPTNLITFNANGGVVDGGNTTTRRITEGQTLGTLPEATRDGYVFEGWYTQMDGGTEVTNQTVPTGVTTYYAHWSVAPTTFDDAYAAAGKTRDVTSGKYTLQDMDSNICNAVSKSSESDYSDTQETQLVDIRDGKVYWVAKLLDGHCWMTQNLDFNIPTTALTSETTDLTYFGDKGYDATHGYSKDASTNVISWTPARATINAVTDSETPGSISGWSNDYNSTYSVDTGDWYWKSTPFYNSDLCYVNSNNQTCNYITKADNVYQSYFSTTPYSDNGTHGHVGNYYNWSAAVASNDTSSYTASTYDDITSNPQNSICPAGWRLPTISNQGNVDGSTSEFARLNGLYGNSTSTDQYITASPLYFVRGGLVNSGSLYGSGYRGYYWSSTVTSSSYAYYLGFDSGSVRPAGSYNRLLGRSLRCIAR